MLVLFVMSWLTNRNLGHREPPPPPSPENHFSKNLTTSITAQQNYNSSAYFGG